MAVLPGHMDGTFSRIIKAISMRSKTQAVLAAAAATAILLISAGLGAREELLFRSISVTWQSLLRESSHGITGCDRTQGCA